MHTHLPIEVSVAHSYPSPVQGLGQLTLLCRGTGHVVCIPLAYQFTDAPHLMITGLTCCSAVANGCYGERLIFVVTFFIAGVADISVIATKSSRYNLNTLIPVS